MGILHSELKRCLRELVRQKRVDRGLRQEDAGELIHGGQPLVSKWETGKRGMQFTEVYEYCRAFKVDFHEFATEYDRMVRRVEAGAKKGHIPNSHTGFRGRADRRNPSCENNNSRNLQRPPPP